MALLGWQNGLEGALDDEAASVSSSSLRVLMRRFLGLVSSESESDSNAESEIDGALDGASSCSSSVSESSASETESESSELVSSFLGIDAAVDGRRATAGDFASEAFY